MSLRSVPAHVRTHIYLFWVGLGTSGLGIVGFFLSFWQVGSPAQAAVDVHREVPVLAYASIFAWLAGLIIMWYSRRRLDAAVAAKLASDREAMFVDMGVDSAADAPPADLPTDAPDGRDA